MKELLDSCLQSMHAAQDATFLAIELCVKSLGGRVDFQEHETPQYVDDGDDDVYIDSLYMNDEQLCVKLSDGRNYQFCSAYTLTMGEIIRSLKRYYLK
jgi:hypothetical protein